jgi:hypothetical protein
MVKLGESIALFMDGSHASTRHAWSRHPCLPLDFKHLDKFTLRDDSSAAKTHHNMESGNTTPHDQTSPPPDEHEHDDEDVINPQDKIDTFDWQRLETEYLDAMAECKAEEDVQLEEFASLSRFFGVWAETLSGHEQKRSHQRYAYLQSESDIHLTFSLLA